MLKKKFVKFFGAKELDSYFERVNVWTDELIKGTQTVSGQDRNYEYIEKVMKASYRIRQFYTEIFHDLFFDSKTKTKSWDQLRKEIRRYVDTRISEVAKFNTFMPRYEQ